MLVKDIWHKFSNREFITYIVSGMIVTFANWLIYTFLINVWQDHHWRWANLISIFLSILLAYYLNRVFVFKSSRSVFPEIFFFFISRAVISLLFEHGFMELMINAFHFNPQIVIADIKFPVIKVLASVFVIIGNYLVGKFFVFSKKQVSVQEK